jgi:tRNA pseudouridine38-40 synthase
VDSDGAAFHGSHFQAGVRTVQAELENSVARLTGSKVRCVVSLAGRTDTGVHASGQVANFLTESTLPVEAFRRGLNALLPFDLAIVEASEVAEDFHARFSAKSRRYIYTIINQASRSPLYRRTAYHLTFPLEVSAMHEAATKLIGVHDFASFAGAGWGVSPDEHSTVREVILAECRKVDNLIQLEIAANAFLPHMVRTVVGTLILVGKGQLNCYEFEEILAARNRRKAGRTAPPYGLSLVEVRY